MKLRRWVVVDTHDGKEFATTVAHRCWTRRGAEWWVRFIAPLLRRRDDGSYTLVVRRRNEADR